MSRYVRIIALLLVILFIRYYSIAGDAPTALTNDSIIQMVRWGFSNNEIISAINRNPSQFELSASTVATLAGNGVSDAVLGAMWRATLASGRLSSQQGSGTAVGAAQSGTAQVTAAPSSQAPRTDVLVVQTLPSQTPIQPSNPSQSANLSPGTGGQATTSSATNQPPPHTLDRFNEAIAALNVVNEALKSGQPAPFDPPCPVSGRGKTPTRFISVDWDSGSISPSRVDHSGTTCFEVHNFNDILYSPAFTLTSTLDTTSPFDLLKDAVTTALTFTVGTKAQQQGAGTQGVQAVQPAAPQSCLSPEFQARLDGAQGTASLLQTSLSQLELSKNADGTVDLVPVNKTPWQGIPQRFSDFQMAVKALIETLAGIPLASCTNEDTKSIAAAEAIIIDGYVKAQSNYTLLASHFSSPHIARYTDDLEAISPYSFVVTATYPGAPVANGQKTFLLAAGRKIMTSSGGFVISELPNPSYSSVTAPTGMTNPATQNVLAINNPNGPVVGITALLNVYLPNFFGIPLNSPKYGIALSAGPTFNIANASPDTSRWGLLTGPTLQIRNRFFLTPGVQVGQYSSLPLGYTHAGQVIPANTGTPTGVSRWTARFAFGITYKIRDLGEPAAKTNADGSGSGNSNSTATTPTPKPKQPQNPPGKQSKKTTGQH